jgi:Leucine-rich repeat (LRR) protein
VDLEISHNKLRALPDTLQYMRSLTRLDLRHNLIQSAPYLAMAKGLKELYLGNNAITTLGDFSGFPVALVILDARDNKISELSPNIDQLKALQRLDLTNNDLANLPASMGMSPVEQLFFPCYYNNHCNVGNITSLKSVVLDGNPLKSIRREIISGGTVAIMKYLKTRLEVSPCLVPQ